MKIAPRGILMTTFRMPAGLLSANVSALELPSGRNVALASALLAPAGVEPPELVVTPLQSTGTAKVFAGPCCAVSVASVFTPLTPQNALPTCTTPVLPPLKTRVILLIGVSGMPSKVTSSRPLAVSTLLLPSRSSEI